MTNNDAYQPKPKHKFSFGLWTLGNRGRDPFGDFVRPVISPAEIVAMESIWKRTPLAKVIRSLNEVTSWT